MDKQTDRMEEKVSNIFYHPNGWFHRLVIYEAVLSLLLALSFIGVAYTDIAGGHSINFWLWMIPVFAIAAIMLEWSRYIQGEIDGFHFIRQQVLHWMAVFLAIKLTFVLLQIGRLPNNATAFVLMMIMSLSTFLAGIYIGWRFLVLGAFIALATIVAAYLETYIWVLIPIAILIVALGLFITWSKFRLLKASLAAHS